MALNYVGPGDTIPITGLSTGVLGGALYSYSGGTTVGSNWWGVVANDIIGTSEALTTVDGRPVLDEDLTGLSIQGVNVGTGKGDLKVCGVHELVVGSGRAQQNAFKTGVAVYASGVNVRAGVDLRDAGTRTPTSYGMVQIPNAPTVAPEGYSVVGHVWAPAFLDQREASPFKGGWVVPVKLLGHPMVGLV